MVQRQSNVRKYVTLVTLFYVAGYLLGTVNSFEDDDAYFDDGKQVYEKTADEEAVDALSESEAGFETLVSMKSSQWRCIYHGTSTCRRSCYFFYTSHQHTWYGARTQCQVHGGRLATIDDAIEDAFIRDAIGEHSRLWIGLNDRAIEGIWRWDNGAKVTYLNWLPGEPNNQDNEDCVVMWGKHRGRWNDDDCGEKFGYVCEK